MQEPTRSLVTYVSHSEPLHVTRVNSEVMQEDERGLISLQQVFVILRAHWKISVAVFLVVVAAITAFAVEMPKTYSAVATLIVNHRSQSPLAAQEGADNGTYLYTQMELIQSDSVLDEAISRASLDKVKEFASGNAGGDVTLTDWVAAKLRQNLEVTAGKYGSQLIYVSASASQAGLAADVTNAVVDSFIARQNMGAFSSSSERATRYAEELKALKQKVDSAQDLLTAFRAKAGTVDLDSNSDLDRTLLQALETRLLEVKSALTASRARVSSKQDMTSSMLSSTSIASLREEANKLSTKMAQLRTEYGPQYPEVIALQSQIDANKAALANAKSTIQSANSSDLVVTSNEVADLEKAVAAQRAKVMNVNRYRDEAAKYQLELDSAQSVYRKALDGYDQEYFAAKEGQTSRISVVSRARPPVKPSKGKVVKFIVMGFGLGIALALLLPFGIELPRRRIRCRDDLEKDLSVPMLIELPSISLATASTRGQMV